MKLGFIGTGIIASAVITGFCESDLADLHITVSPRNKDRAAALKAKYPDKVFVAESNQEVIDASDWVFISTLPKATEEIIMPLTWPAEKKVISLVSSLSMKRLREIVGEREVICDVLPLTFAADRIGPVVCYPAIPEVRDLIAKVGDAIAVDDPQKMAVFRAITCHMSSYYMLLTKLIDWCVENGADEPSARTYVTEFTKALSTKAATWPAPLETLAREYTPGGLNWQVLTALEEGDCYTPWTEALAPVMEKVIKEK